MIVQNHRFSGAAPKRGGIATDDDGEIVENGVGADGDAGISMSVHLTDPFVVIVFGGGNGKGEGGEKGDRQCPECALRIGINAYRGGVIITELPYKTLYPNSL